MANVDELKRQLEQAKKDEKQKDKDRKFKDMHKQIGIGQSSHSLNTYMNSGKAGYDFQMFYIKGVKIVHKEPRYVIDVINVRKMGNSFRVDLEESEYRTDIPYYLGATRYPITQADIDTFRHSFIPKLELSIDELRHDYKAGRLMSQGEHFEEESAYKLLKQVGNTFMMLKDDHFKVWELLKWNNHPYLYNEFLLISDDSFEIIKNIADNLKRGAASWGGSIWERDYPRAETLTNFYNKYKNTKNDKK